jgi:hypothetical protein
MTTANIVNVYTNHGPNRSVARLSVGPLPLPAPTTMVTRNKNRGKCHALRWRWRLYPWGDCPLPPPPPLRKGGPTLRRQSSMTDSFRLTAVRKFLGARLVAERAHSGSCVWIRCRIGTNVPFIIQHYRSNVTSWRLS